MTGERHRVLSARAEPITEPLAPRRGSAQGQSWFRNVGGSEPRRSSVVAAGWREGMGGWGAGLFRGRCQLRVQLAWLSSAPRGLILGGQVGHLGGLQGVRVGTAGSLGAEIRSHTASPLHLSSPTVSSPSIIYPPKSAVFSSVPFPTAVVTNHHKLGDLKQHKCII